MNNDARAKLGNRIRQAREARGWTQAELGKMLKYKFGNFVGVIEFGKAEIPFEKIPLLSEILGFDPRTAVAKRPNISQPAVSISVRRGEKISRDRAITLSDT